MFDDAEAIRKEYSYSSEYYMSEREYSNMPGVLKLNAYGSLDWVIELKPAQYFNDMDERQVMVTTDGKYWITFNYSEDDTLSEFGGMNDFSRLVLIGSDGTILQEKTFSDDKQGILKAPALQQDGSLLGFFDKGDNSFQFNIGRIDQQGVLDKKPVAGLDGLWINEVYQAGDYGFIVTGKVESQENIYLVDKSGALTWKNPVTETIQYALPCTDGIMVVSTEKFAWPDGDKIPLQYTVKRYTKAGEVGPVMTFTHNGAILFSSAQATSYNGLMLAGDAKNGEESYVSFIVTVPAENGDIFRNMNTYNYKEYTKAVVNNDMARIQALAAFHIDPDFKPATDGDNQDEVDNPLLLAFRMGNYNIAELLMKSGADPDLLDKIPVRYKFLDTPELYNLLVTPLMYIALTPDFYDAAKYTDLLKKYNADFKRITRDGTAFDQAFRMQNTAFLDLYIKTISFSAWDLNGYFDKAFSNNLPNSLKWLLDNGANPYDRDFLGNVIMDQGMQSDSKEIKAVLKEYAKTHKQ
jgi:hypothetical protein